MKTAYAFAALLAVTLGGMIAADEAGIILPISPGDPAPQPAVTTPTTVDTIEPSQWYVIESAERIRVLASPADAVQIEEEQGPIKLRGQFAGSQKTETRTYSGPWVYVITADAPGQCELLLIPGSLERPAIRQRLTISGTGPRPPPKPDPQPEPVPVVPPQGLQVMLLIDQGDSVSALNAVNGVAVLQWLDANTTPTDGRPGWRRWDRSSLSDPATLATESPVWRKLWSDIGSGIPSGPQLVVVTGTKVTTRAITTQDQLLKDLQAAKEGRL
jgi:hypothetical protein